MPTRERYQSLTPEQRASDADARRAYLARKRLDPEWVEQERARERERYQRRKATQPAKLKAYHEKAQAVFRLRHREKLRAARRAYVAANRELERERNKRYRSTPEAKAKASAYAREYRRRHPELARLYQWRKRGSKSTAREWARILLGDPCSYCGSSCQEIDHIVAVTKGGSGEWENLTASCLPCNRSKKNHPLLLWLAKVKAA